MRRDISILGLCTRFEADDASLLAAALSGFGDSLPEAEEGRPDARIVLRRGEMREIGDAEIRVEGSRLILRAGGARGEADATRCEARADVATELVESPQRLVAEVVDPLILFLLTRLGRVPLHAAGVLAGGTALLLAGPTGTGKSTLALAALRRGLTVLSDDTVYVQLEPRLRVWGLRRPIHILPDTPVAAGERSGEPRMRRGRWKLPVNPGSGERVAESARLFLLERGDRVAMRPLSPDEAQRGLEETLEAGFDHFRDEIGAVARAVASSGAWRVTLSSDPEEALEAMLEAAGRGTSRPPTSA